MYKGIPWLNIIFRDSTILSHDLVFMVWVRTLFALCKSEKYIQLYPDSIYFVTPGGFNRDPIFMTRLRALDVLHLVISLFLSYQTELFKGLFNWFWKIYFLCVLQPLYIDNHDSNKKVIFERNNNLRWKVSSYPECLLQPVTAVKLFGLYKFSKVPN